VTETQREQWPEARQLADHLIERTGQSVRVVLLYGSRLLRANPDGHSAFDFVVIVDDYRAFYSGLSRAGELSRPVGVMTGFSRLLAPNVIAYAPEEGRAGIAKCLVVSKDHFSRALGPNPPDHFLLGRMVQRIGTVWAADQAESIWVEAQLHGAHMGVLRWMAPYLEGRVDALVLGRRLLEVCYQGEFRPESKGRAGRIFETQIDHFAVVLGPPLEEAVSSGRMKRDGPGYVLADAVSPSMHRKWRWHFRRSKARTTMRWLKHSITFANWLPYLVRKVERHTGRTIQLTLLERKLPAIFLWPRAIHVLLTRPRREIEP
jgi:hypothetical protein